MRIVSNLSGAQRLIALFLIVSVIAIPAAWMVVGWATGITIAVLVVGILWISRPVLKPSEPSTSIRVHLKSLSVISAVALAVASQTPEAKPLVTRLLHWIGIEKSVGAASAPLSLPLSALILAFTLVSVVLVNWLAKDTSAMRRHPKSLNEDFPEQSYRERLVHFTKILSGRLTALDEETKWDDYYFTPLEAEVDIVSGRESRKTVVDLMTALKADNRSRVVLVLGDPGSGKSIALRQLSKHLINEVNKTGRVPVYVNLKEWGTDRTWTEQEPPTEGQFRAFILRTLRGNNVFADQFLTEYFDRMVNGGRFFFLLDSFDEIPGVLDVGEASWLVQHLSAMIAGFFAGQGEGRGIVASRVYRRPRFNRAQSATLEIRPFSDLRIHDALMKSGRLRKETVDTLFAHRTELIPIARNPFSAALIRIYAENNAGELPPHQLAMFENYIANRFASASDRLRAYSLTPDQLELAATEIAWCMFQVPEIGLEASVARLASLLPGTPVDAVTQGLRYAGLARLSPGPDAQFSFVHRRLNEYFVARRILKDPSTVSLFSIPSDSRYRDALVLYCEVGQAIHLTGIATFCWTEITRGGKKAPLQDLRAVHCLRFLRDAFRTRSQCIDFLPALATYIAEKVKPDGDLLAAKLALEATGLLPEKEAEPILVAALATGNHWLSETAFHSCRHLKSISPALRLGLTNYFRSIPIREFLRRRRELQFALSRSDAFIVLRRYCALRSLDYKFLIFGVCNCVLGFPVLGVGSWMFYSFQSLDSGDNTNATADNTYATKGGPAFPVKLMIWIERIISSRFNTAVDDLKPHMRTSRTVSLIMMLRVQAIFMLVLNGGIFGDIPRSGPFLNTYVFLGTPQLVAKILAAGAVLAVTPFLDIYTFLSNSKWTTVWNKRTLVKTLILIAFAASTIAGIWMVAFTIIGLAKVLGFSEASVLYTLLGAMFLVVLYVVGTHLAALIRDRAVLREITRSNAISRAIVAKDFENLRTEKGQLQYVEWLRDNQVKPSGKWPSGRPNRSGNQASTLLAELDELWLGLDS